jgi:uncharacterized membrane protein
MAGKRALWFAAAPALTLFGFINWDLLPVMLTVVGFYYWSRGRPIMAAVALALGGCAKVWPALFLVPLILDTLSRSGRWEAAKVAGAGVATGLVVNVPFMLVNFSGWYAPFAYQSAIRVTMPGSSLWSWGLWGLPGATITKLSVVLTLSSVAAASRYGWGRYRVTGEFPFLQVSGAIVMAYVCLSKDNSAQYLLWLLPFFALLPVRPALWAQLMAVGVVFYTFFLGVDVAPVMYAASMWEIAVLAFAIYECLRAPSLLQGCGIREGARGGGWAPGLEIVG